MYAYTFQGQMFSPTYESGRQKYQLRYWETNDKISLWADLITAVTGECEVTDIKIDYANKIISEFDKTTKEVKNVDGLILLHKWFQLSDKRQSDRTLFINLLDDNQRWLVDVFGEEDFVDYVRRCVYYLNPNMFRKMNFFVGSKRVTCLAAYFEHLNAIENLCGISDVSSIWDQLAAGEIDFKQGNKLKSKVGIPIDVLNSLHEHGLDSYISDIQTLINQDKMNPDEVRLIIAFCDAISKLKKKRKLDLTGDGKFSSYFWNSLFESIGYGLSATDIANHLAREILMFDKLNDPARLCISTMSKIRDIGKMMIESGRKPELEQNIVKWHAIVARNMKISEKKRSDEYRKAAQLLNQRSMVLDNYLIKCPETEDELINIGLAYRNCLPTYRDRIIDAGAIVYSVYKVGHEDEIPEVTFECTPELEFIQIRTFFDANVEDQEMLDVLKQWRAAARKISVTERIKDNG